MYVYVQPYHAHYCTNDAYICAINYPHCQRYASSYISIVSSYTPIAASYHTPINTGTTTTGSHHDQATMQVMQLLRAKGAAVIRNLRPDNTMAFAQLFTSSLLQVWCCCGEWVWGVGVLMCWYVR